MKTISKLFRCVISAILFFSTFLCVQALADDGVKKVYSSKEGMQYAVAQGGIWLNENGLIKFFPETEYEPYDVYQVDNISHITVQGGDLYFTSDDEEGQTISAISNAGLLLIDKVRIQSDSEIVQMEEHYVLDAQGRISTIYAYDGTLTPLSIDGWKNEGVTAFSYLDPYLITYKGSTGELALIYINYAQTAFPPVTVPDLSWIQVGRVDAATGYALGLTPLGQLLRIDLKTGSYEEVAVGLPADCAGLRRDYNNVYTLGNYYTTLYKLPVNQLLGLSQGDKTTLTIVNLSPETAEMRKTVELFHEKYPDVTVAFRSVNDNRVTATELMSGCEGMDILALQEGSLIASQALLLKNGAIANLNQFPELVALKDEYRDIWGAFSIGDQWYTIPEGLTSSPWRVNTSLAEEIGWEPPTGRWTWADFMVLAEDVKAWNETSDKHIFLLQDDDFFQGSFFSEYQANHIDAYHGVGSYQNETYLNLLRMWKQLHDDELIYKKPQEIFDYINPNALLYSYNGAAIYDLKSNFHIYPPTETLETRIPFYCRPGIVLNANSPHLEEAVYFLACYLNPEAMSRYYYWNMGQLLKDKSLYNTDRVWGATISPANETLWNNMLTQGIPMLYLYDIQRTQWKTLFPGLLDGSISPEQFAAISQQLADMVLGE